MKEKNLGKLILDLVFLTFFVTLIVISMTYSAKARRMPLVVLMPGAVLAAIVTIRDGFGKRPVPKRREIAAEDEEMDDTEPEGPVTEDHNKRMFVMFGWMALLVGMIWVVGFLVTIPVYTILFMRSLKESWRLSIIFGVAGFIVLYFLFVVGLNMELYPGLIFQS